MNDPHIWWYITRASALLAWVLLAVSVVWGILLSTRVARRIDNPAWLQDLHRFLSGMGIVLLGVHVVSLMLDGFIHFSLVDVLVPFAASYRPIGVALGVTAMYLLVAIWCSSLIRDRLPRRVWKGIHYASYAVVLAVAVHAGLSGSDVGEPWYTALALSIIGALALATIVRVLVGRPANRKARETQSLNARAAIDAPAGSAASHAGFDLVIRGRRRLAKNVIQLELAATDGSPLPIWWPGDHVSLRLPGGLVRQYSLCGDPANRRSWLVAVRRDPKSRGGSAWLCESAALGDVVRATGPVHRFELEPAASYSFIAAGIGITPIQAMIQSLPAQREWRLIYIGRSLDVMPFAAELLQAFPDRVQLWETALEGARPDLARLDLDSALVYACGPLELLDELATLVPPNRLRTERFVAIDALPRTGDTPFDIECRTSNVTVHVGAEDTALSALERAGVPVLASCREGSCGSCELRVIAGEPDHRDDVLDDDSKAAFGVMYPCVSRARGDRLVVDA
ncbi:MAG TPA: 2Fe-2S iron-sulfur cluster-binding protein [Microbacteriaceae bacterium]|nr:2Fe-2S iron-sulfur cluster-binding protein [Microbacteriaceae bacterium]